jgi:hypothetical protein
MQPLAALLIRLLRVPRQSVEVEVDEGADNTLVWIGGM